MIKKLGSVPFLNSKPLTYSFDKGLCLNYKTQFYYPSELLDSLKSGETFLSLLSIADHFSDPNIISLEDYCISAEGKVDSVILAANSDINKLETVYLDPISKSANLLFKVIQENFLNNKVSYSFLQPKIKNSYISNSGQVIIGDLALKFLSQRPSGLRIYDLAELWNKETSLPFTFATFNYDTDQPSNEEVQLLKESFKKGSENVDALIKDFIIENNSQVKLKILETYLKERIIYKLTMKHIEGINLFYRLSSKFAKWEKRSFNNLL